MCLCIKQKTAYEMRISDWSSDVCSSDLASRAGPANTHMQPAPSQYRPAAMSNRGQQERDERTASLRGQQGCEVENMVQRIAQNHRSCLDPAMRCKGRWEERSVRKEGDST